MQGNTFKLVATHRAQSATHAHNRAAPRNTCQGKCRNLGTRPIEHAPAQNGQTGCLLYGLSNGDLKRHLKIRVTYLSRTFIIFDAFVTHLTYL